MTERLPRVLTVSNMYPHEAQPAYGTFVASQVESLRALGVETDVLFIDGRTSRRNYARGVRHLRHMIARGNYDLIHAHYGLTGCVARLQRPLPLVVSFCGDDLLGTPGRRHRRTLGSMAIVCAGHALERMADAIIVKSEEMRGHLWLASSRRRAWVLPNGVNLQAFQPMERQRARQLLGLSNARRYVLFPHTPHEVRKRVDLAQEAVRVLRARMADVELLIVADQPPERMPAYYSAGDAMLLTSDWEGSPNVVKEALACDLPVVSVPCGDVAERIAGLPSCHLCPRDPHALAAALEKTLGEPRPADLRAAVRSLDTAAVARKLVDIYRVACAA